MRILWDLYCLHSYFNVNFYFYDEVFSCCFPINVYYIHKHQPRYQIVNEYF